MLPVVASIHTYYACGTVADFVILRFAQLYHQLRYFVVHIHLLKNGRAVVGDGDVAVAGDEHLVEAFRAEGAFQRGSHRLGRQDVALSEAAHPQLD